MNTVTNKVSRVLGKDETLRFLNLSLYQGAPAKKGLTTLVGRLAIESVQTLIHRPWLLLPIP